MNNKLQIKWEKRATVRSRPKVVYDKEAKGYYYPISRTPLAIHPTVMAKGERAIEFLLIQSLYKYSNDIATIETRVVNETIIKVLTNKMPIEFNKEQKINLYTIMVDEAYHAYVAFDAMLQIENHTGVEALPLPEVIEIEKAITKVREKLDQKYHNIFDLICICLAENTLTKEIITMTDQEETHPFFQKIIKDHFADEERHSGIFYKLLEFIWINLNEEYKEHIGEILVDFIEEYLGLTIQIKFDKQVLSKIGFSDEEASKIVEDTYGGFKLTKHHPMLKNIIILLDKTGVFDQFTLPKFEEKEWA
ncbi:hypothetical protein NIES4106_59310 (plasmid) [Fischerella sp. NIES-4106]|nr:hypothetical protein NIES4106_59310 [Fischerella sp. NIES-4106]